jgi:DNA-binding NarL/FixJ family response regulator
VRQNSEQEPYPFPELTARERDVLDGIAAGRSNAVIAADLGLSPKTVSNRVSSIFGKLGVAHRAQAIVLARDVGLGRG